MIYNAKQIEARHKETDRKKSVSREQTHHHDDGVDVMKNYTAVMQYYPCTILLLP